MNDKKLNHWEANAKNKTNKISHILLKIIIIKSENTNDRNFHSKEEQLGKDSIKNILIFIVYKYI